MTGIPFCVTEFGLGARLTVQAAFGAEPGSSPGSWVWTDISGSVRYAESGRITISPMGRSDETSTAQPAGCAFELDNETGDFTPYYSGSQYYPYVRRNTPLRVLLNLDDGVGDVVRFQGFVTGWTPGWDISAEVATVGVQAQGITRRLSQGTSPLKSPLTRSILVNSLTAFWPLDEGNSATQVLSGLSGGQAMTFTDGVLLGEYTDLQGMVRAADPGNGSLHAPVDTTLTPASGSNITWSAGFAMKVGSVPLNDPLSFVPLLSFNTGGNYYRWDISLLIAETGDITVIQRSTVEADTNYTFSPPGAVGDLYNGWHFYEFTCVYNNALNRFTLSATIDGVSASSGSDNLGFTASTCAVRSVDINPTQADFGPFGIAGLYVINGAAPSAPAGAAVDGYAGESPVTRIERLCAEEGVAVTTSGTSTSTMGPQGVDSLLKLLRQCETTDQGVLYDGASSGLRYVARSERYNLASGFTVDAAAGELGYPFTPVDDDQRNRNLAKASREGGTSATYEDRDGPLGTTAVGTYDTSVTVNVELDSAVADYASWLVHLGTVEGFRWPRLALNLRASPGLAADWLQCAVSSRVDVTNVDSVASQHPADDIRLILEGWQEILSPVDWTVQANTSQYEPWEVGVLDSTYVLDCGASTLSAGINSSTTTIPLNIADVCVWSHATGDFQITVGGEVMTVTATGAASGAGSSWTQNLTVTRGVNGPGFAHSSGEQVHATDSLILAL
jgi:hypothetical protein